MISDIYKQYQRDIKKYVDAIYTVAQDYLKDNYSCEENNELKKILDCFVDNLRNKYCVGENEVQNIIQISEKVFERIYDKGDCDSKMCNEIIEYAYHCVDVCDRTLSVVAILKNEGKYVKEWLDYHILAGVSHFYIYDNESTDGLKDIIGDYIAMDIVTYIYYPGEIVQKNAYNDALRKYKNDTKYMAFIDGDEFIVSVEDKNLSDVVDEVFEECMDKFRRQPSKPYRPGGIGVNWMVYGTSFYKEMPDGGVLENYIYRAADEDLINTHIKTICNPRVSEFVLTPHSIAFEEGYLCISEKGSCIGGPYFYDASYSKLRINHYITKSENEFREKRRRGYPDQEHKEIMDEELDKELKSDKIQRLNAVCDTIMLKYVDRIRSIMS